MYFNALYWKICIALLCSVFADPVTYYSWCLVSLSDDKVLPACSNGKAVSGSHPCLASAIIYQRLLQCRYHRIATSTRCSYQSGISAFQRFCTKHAVSSLPASSLTLQYFCASKSQHVSHKTLKVYLCGIRLWHIEEGFEDPKSDLLLQLVCRGIRCLQGDRFCTWLPTTINILHTLKYELNLWWSDISCTHRISINLKQSETHRFRKGHLILILYPTYSCIHPPAHCKLSCCIPLLSTKPLQKTHFSWQADLLH